MNDTDTIKLINTKLINDVVSILGKEESIKRYNSLKARNPEIYADTSKGIGRDVLEYINGL